MVTSTVLVKIYSIEYLKVAGLAKVLSSESFRLYVHYMLYLVHLN